VLIENSYRASVHGVSMENLKFTSEKTVQPNNVQHVSSINKNLVKKSLFI
jgi:hypothetical protein